MLIVNVKALAEEAVSRGGVVLAVSFDIANALNTALELREDQ